MLERPYGPSRKLPQKIIQGCEQLALPTELMALNEIDSKQSFAWILCSKDLRPFSQVAAEADSWMRATD
jgi:hypothetical protein